MDITSLIIQLVVGAIGGNAASKVMPDKSLGTLGNTIAGVVGGGLGGQILNSVLGGGMAPAAGAVASSGMDIGSIIQQVAGGGIGGAVMMVIAGLVKGAMAKA
jgi:uncharacterized membrane protein YeaQ/YmgE (transglycosylase-associated protein family)